MSKFKATCINIDSIRDVSPYGYGNWKVGSTYLVEEDEDDSSIYTYNVYTINKDYINSITTEEYNKSFITLNEWRQQQLNKILDGKN